ncbi:trehalase-like [Periplaneta americana]|uniref:trehalase-like n=1 Tax=Periplaneta americana TaxID=6978 RepID=UPI0037E89467
MLFALIILLLMASQDASSHECRKEIFCLGNLLHEVQMAAIYPDSKTFVDMKLKYPPHVTLKHFDDFLNQTKKTISRSKLEKFVSEHFEDVGSEFETWYPPDWHGNPAIFNKIIDPKMKLFAKRLHSMWKYLGRKIKEDVHVNPDLYSMVYVPNAVIVPGGRFREFYYWDSYWIIRGLLNSEMFNTVKGMLANFLYMVEQYGLVPNGGRVYYTGRSQPPMLIPMIYDYVQATGDLDFVGEHLSTMEEEYAFWLTNRTVKIKKDRATYSLFRFNDETKGPRPESYREDHNAAHLMGRQEEKEAYYAEMKAAAESGRDFSSRWFIFNASNQGDLFDTKVRYIVPVDLNALMHMNARMISGFCSDLGYKNKAAYYKRKARDLLNAIQKVLWHEDLGIWLDWDLLNGKRRNYFYPSNLAPLWTGSFPHNDDEKLATQVLQYLEANKVDAYPGGIPSSFEVSGEQWDFPNIWPPLQDMIITGLNNLESGKAREYARNHAFRWVYTMYRGYMDTRAMYEKYDATVSGAPGGGGEYTNQIGFGWTNGIALDMLNKYGDQLLPPPENFPSMKERPFLSLRCKFITIIVTLITFLNC